MTLVLTWLFPFGIVMGADSAMTYKDRYMIDHLGRRRPLILTSGRKIFPIPKINSGISFWGDAVIGNRTTFEWISNFIYSHENQYNTLNDFAILLQDELRNIIPEITESEDSLEYRYGKRGFHLAGFVDYLQENILNPLNMTSTGFSVSNSPDKQAIPHERVFGVLSKTNVELPLYDSNLIRGGGMRSTVPDLAQFLIAHMNQGQINGFQLLKPETVELMHEPTVSFPPQSIWVGYGLGWIHLNNVTYKHHYFHGAQGHGGANWGFSCHMWFVEKTEGAYGILLMTTIYTNIKADSIYDSAIDLIRVVLLHEASVMFSQTPQD
jgi:hypothetical protein